MQSPIPVTPSSLTPSPTHVAPEFWRLLPTADTPLQSKWPWSSEQAEFGEREANAREPYSQMKGLAQSLEADF